MSFACRYKATHAQYTVNPKRPSAAYSKKDSII